MNEGRVAAELNSFVSKVINEPSLGLFFIQHHIKETTPALIEFTEEMRKCNFHVQASISDADNTLAEVRSVTSLTDKWCPYVCFLLDKAHQNLDLKKIPK